MCGFWFLCLQLYSGRRGKKIKHSHMYPLSNSNSNLSLSLFVVWSDGQHLQGLWSNVNLLYSFSSCFCSGPHSQLTTRSTWTCLIKLKRVCLFLFIRNVVAGTLKPFKFFFLLLLLLYTNHDVISWCLGFF